MQVGVAGLGYVGQPLAAAFAEAGLSVVGYDIDEACVDALKTQWPPATGPSGGLAIEEATQV